jgi:ABC-type thiamine transport system ATPase subunit
MAVDYKLAKIIIRCFRGIQELELEFRDGYPTVLIGSNNAGKTTILNAIALAFHNGEFYNWSPDETDYYCDPQGNRSKDFLIQVHFKAGEELGLPAVRTIGDAQFVYGVQVVGRTGKDGALSHTRTLLGKDGKPITLNTRTKQSEADKKAMAQHNVGWRTVNAKLDDIREHLPETWFFKPEDIQASLYIWKTGPLAKLSNHLADRFTGDAWTMTTHAGEKREMPATLENGYRFFQQAVAAFPFWKDIMKPDLEKTFGRYIGGQARIDLKTNTQGIKEWLAQQLMISMATDPESAPTPLRNMGDGRQSVVRLAALEALTHYPELVRERIVLLLEEPETHLHPHLRRKVRKILGELAAKGWTIVYTTHSPELVSFEENLVISRLVRSKGNVLMRSVHTDAIEAPAKLQSKLDDNGAHDFLFSTGAVFCEGPDDTFSVKYGFEKSGVDVDGYSVSVTQCGGCTAIPSFAYIAKELGIRWVALTDQDLQADGTEKPQTVKQRALIENYRQNGDLQCQWPVHLESCLAVTAGKANPEVTLEKLTNPDWKADHPQFLSTLATIATWIDPEIKL